jgi:Immunoglobulin I-set domain
VHLSVSATGGPPLAYQWKKDGVALSDGGSISGSASPDLYFAPAAAADTGIYSVTISNPCGSVNSSAASVLVCTPGGDLNGDGAANGDDIQQFVNAVLANSAAASDVCAGDFSLNLNVDADDVDAFVAALLSS